MSFTSVTVSGTYVRGPEQTPAGGEVEFQYSAPMQDSLGNVIATTTPLVVVLDAAGSFSVALPATDDTGVVPTGVTIAVTERIEDARERRYSITLPKAVTAVNLADVAPAIAGPQLFQYALVGHTHVGVGIALDDLTDVFAPAPTDLYVLSWVAANNRYELVLPTILGAPSTADYLTGSTQAGLSNEIVVGLTPQGELGGTWGSPTVDASHSGSTHAATQAAAEATAAAALSGHAGAADPHAAYATDADLSAHEGAADPHAGYVQESALDESIDDRVVALIQPGTGISWVYSDALGTFTPTVTLAPFTTTNLAEGSNLYFTDERAQDAVGSAATDTASVNVTYNDALGTFVWDVLPAGVDHNSLANLTTGDPHTQYQKESEKGIALGYASLGADVLVPQDQLGTGAQDGTKFLRDDGTWQSVPSGYTDEQAQDAVGAMLLDTASVDLAYVDATPALSATVLPAGVDHNALANLTVGNPHTQYVLASVLSESIDDRVAALILNGTGLTWTYGDIGNTLTGNVSLSTFSTSDLAEGTNPYFTDERAQDAVGGILVDTSSIDFVYSDATPSITAVVRPSSVTTAMLAFDPATQAELDTHAGAVDPHAVYVLESLLDAKGDLLTATADNTPARFAAGTNGQVLTAQSAQATGLLWATLTTSDIGEGSNLYYTDERVDDRVASLWVDGTGIDSVYDDVLNTFTVTVDLSELSTSTLPEGTNLYYTAERAQDDVAAALLDSASVDLTYVDATPSISAAVLPAGVDHNSLANITTGDPHTQYLLESIFAGKGDVLTATANDAPAILSVGADNTFLRANSAATNGIEWLAVDHGANVAGLADDDHSQYLLLAGRSGGQSPIGGTASGDDLTLRSTSHATKGTIFFGAAGASAYDEVNERLGVGYVGTPSARLHVEALSGTNTAIFTNLTAPSSTSGALMFFMIEGAIPSAADQRLAGLNFGARLSSSSRLGAYINAYSAEAWAAGTAHGSYISFETTPVGSATRTPRLRVGADGTVGVLGAGVFGAALGTAPTNASVGLEVNSTTKAFLLPRMTTVQRDAITALGNAVKGMLIYNTTSQTAQVFAGGGAGAWVDS